MMRRLAIILAVSLYFLALRERRAASVAA